MSQYNACEMCKHCEKAYGVIYCKVEKEFKNIFSDTSECPHYEDKEEGEGE